MQPFTDLYFELDATTRTAEKVAALEDYFAHAEPRDAAWALYFLTGRKIKRAVNTKLLREWVSEATGFPVWLVEESYEAVGDLAEALALLLPDWGQAANLPLARIVEERIVPLPGLPAENQRELLRDTWRLLDHRQRMVWHKLITGEFRVGVAATLVARAMARVARVPLSEMTHRLMGHWSPTSEHYAALLRGAAEQNPAQPYPFFLAHPLESPLAELGSIDEWQAEWKWDGIRAQLIHRQGQVLVWSRGEELVTDRFPEVRDAGRALPAGTVLDGEILPWRNSTPLPFAVLQRRIGRKTVGPKLLAEAPVAFMAYDVLEHEARDVRPLPLVERRGLLDQIVASMTSTSSLLVSPLVVAGDWEELGRQRAAASDRAVEGLMLKRRDSPYGVGRPRGAWWKWKIDPHSIDAVLIYAQQGHGRRASLYTDYTFGVWDGGQLVPVAKAYSGLTDAEIREVDAFIRRHTLERHGPVRVVQPELVFELHFEGIQSSKRHKSGLAVRFPRMARWRRDKAAAQADTLDALKQMAEGASTS